MSTSKDDDKTAFLEYFWDLAAEDNDRRLRAAQNVVKYVLDKPKDHDDVQYALKRLIRGLSSSREAARQGFATCLTEIIKFQFIEIPDILGRIDELTKVYAPSFLSLSLSISMCSFWLLIFLHSYLVA